MDFKWEQRAWTTALARMRIWYISLTTFSQQEPVGMMSGLGSQNLKIILWRLWQINKNDTDQEIVNIKFLEIVKIIWKICPLRNIGLI